MAVLNDPDQLTQGTSSAETLAWTASAGAVTTLTGTGLPAIGAGEYFEIRDHSVSNNNGLYYETGGSPTTSSVTCTKVAGPNPTNAGSEAVTWLGDSNTLAKNVMFDTARKTILLIKQQGLSNDGVTLNALYSFAKEEWKDDDFLRQFQFPMFAIDLDAGKYQIGTDGANNSGWDFEDVTSPAVNTTKLVRDGGWLQKDSAGITKKIYAGIVTLGTFEDTANDLAYYQFGTDTTVNDTVDFDFAGPVNEAVLCYEELGNPDTCNFATTTTITRATGSFITDGYKVGGEVAVRNSTSNDGTYAITAVAATTLTCGGATFTTGADTNAQLSVDNRKAFNVKLRVRDADPNGKTFDQSDLTAIGKTTLNNFIFSFPLSNATDLKISETDANIDANTPYTGMTITYYATPQSKSGLVGGSFDFGIVINANNGTAIQVYEFVQRQLRKTSDIDNDADTHIGRAMDGLLVFEGDTLVSGKSIPDNPDGGGSGVYIENIAAADKNNLSMFDNTGTARTFPETISVTLDFNDALINDTVAEYVLYFDRTIRTTVSDLVINSGSPATFTSAGANLPTLNTGALQYVRISGLTGGDAAMNGIYQVTTETSTSSWDVVRYDGATVVTTSSASVPLDQYPIDSPDAIIVQDDVPANVTGLASSDYNFSFDFDGNTQGGRVVSTDTFVVGRAIGLGGAQFVQSSVQTIQSGTPLTIVLTASNELNYVT
jgi:hypothetical protein